MRTKTCNLFLLLIIACIAVNAQNKTFDFIRRADVSWAADLSTAYQFSQQNISLLLRNKLAEGTLKVFIPGDNGEAKPATAADVRQRIAPGRTASVVDDNGNVVQTVMEATDPLFDSRYFTDATNSNILLTQLLYIQDGKLKIYIPAAAPKYTVVTSWREVLGEAPAFTTATNKCRQLPKPRKRFILLDNASSIMVPLDSRPVGAMVKQLFEQNLLQALWPYLGNNGYRFYIGNSKESVPFEALSMNVIEGDAVIKVPVYDASGNISAYTDAPPQPLDLTRFTKMEVQKATWYDPKKQRFYSRPTALILYAHRWLNGGRELQASPVLRIALDGR